MIFRFVLCVTVLHEKLLSSVIQNVIFEELEMIKYQKR